MNQDIDQKNGPRQELADSVAAFLMTGGVIQVLAAPWERAPEEKEKSRRGPSRNISYSEKKEVSADRAALIIKVRECAAKHSISQTSKILGISRYSLADIAQANRFSFRPTTMAELTPEEQQAEKAKVDRICALRDVGLTHRQCYVQIGMGHKKFMELLEKYSIDYPRRDHLALKESSK